MFNQLFSLSNILKAWRKFKSGKTRKKDIVSFEYHLEDNILLLHDNICLYDYKHRPYDYFQIFDSKKRDIYKAEVSDRIIHQIIYDYLKSIYEPLFISDSYSSRDRKGHHKSVKTLKYFIKLAGSGNQEDVFVLKCDIKKYFNNIDHVLLFGFIKEKITDLHTLSIIQEIISSFKEKGIPLGNITSQIFANIYLHELDMYIKKELRCRFYIRYNDDFVIVSKSQRELEIVRSKVMNFVSDNLKLAIPFEKTSIRKASWGINFLGYNILTDAILLLNNTKSKMYSRINKNNKYSYLGILKHCNSYTLRQKILSTIDN